MELDWKINVKKKDYGIGVIGAGWVAKNYLLPSYKKAGFNLVAVADIKKESVELAQKEFGIEKGFTDYHEMLKMKEVQIVDITIPTFGRVQVVKDVAKAGKHMLVQKPFTRSYKEGLEMIEAAENAGVKLGVNSHYRWLSRYRCAYLLLKQGYIGEPVLIIDEMRGNQDYVYYHVIPERRWNATIDDFMFVEWGAHHFDFLRFWAGKEPKSIYCRSTKMPGQNFKSDMVVLYTLDFPGNLRASLLFNQVSQADDGCMRFRIEGPEGVIESSGGEVRCYSKKFDNKWQSWTVEEPPKPGEKYPEFIFDSFIGTMGELMNAITENREHISSGRDNLKTVQCYLAGMLSAKEGRPVKPDEIKK